TLAPDASVNLVSYSPDRLEYRSENTQNGLLVFSEMYYPHGWKATIDGDEVPFFCVNYTLRALEVPAGTHTITFSFDPDVVKTGSTLALAGNIVLFLALAGGVFYGIRKREKEE